VDTCNSEGRALSAAEFVYFLGGSFVKRRMRCSALRRTEKFSNGRIAPEVFKLCVLDHQVQEKLDHRWLDDT
jgi:hypothetical protein